MLSFIVHFQMFINFVVIGVVKNEDSQGKKYGTIFLKQKNLSCNKDK